MERKSPKTILQLKSSMYHATPFVLKYQDFGPPETNSGTALFYLYDKNYAYEYVTLCYAA